MTDRFYEERFHILRALIRNIAPMMEVNDIIEAVRRDLRRLIPNAMEVCVLLMDPEADRYTSPLQCALYERPVNCQLCKRDRPAVKKAIQDRAAVVAPSTEPATRPDGTMKAVGPEYAMPVFVEDRILAVISVVIQPMTRYTPKAELLIKDFADILGYIILNARRQWENTRDKIHISQTLAGLSAFVPGSVRRMAERDPDLLTREKEKKEISVLFLDIEGYTALSTSRPEDEVNAVIERIFSSFVDPIHRCRGEINETSGDGLMIIFKDYDPRTNAINAVKAAFEIMARARSVNDAMATESGFSEIGPVAVNIGINSGTALVGMTRFKGALDTRMTFTATGSVTNIAARLSDYAGGGDILTTTATRELIDGLWPVYGRGPVRLKGIDSPVPVFSLLGPLL